MKPIPRENEAARARWRLVLGQYSQKQLGSPEGGRQARMDRALQYLYGREYCGRGMRERGDGREQGRGGTLDPSVLTVPAWLSEVRELFPQETCLTLEKHALENYGLVDLVKDPKVLERAKPDLDLLKTVLGFKGHMSQLVFGKARQLVKQVVEELRRKLEQEIRQAMSGQANRLRHSPVKVMQNFDWRATIRRNLKNYDPENRRIVLEQLRFFSRQQRRVPWRVILCVDQSGSMLDSVIHAAVTASILASLPAVTVKLVVFDTNIVDLSDKADDALEVLMSVQLGGGTNIGSALTYCETLVEDAPRTALILISDFEEGAPPNVMLGCVRRLRESGVRLLGLAALDEKADPWFDRAMAGRLQRHGMEIAALTPKKLAEWLAAQMKF
jgi:Mg-chelatase subunit ChlD